MSATLGVSDQPLSSGKLLRRAAGLLSQQIWCWGRDVLRPEGNWLIETGFDRIEAPQDRKNCSSVYTLELPEGHRVVLRGFGVFYGADDLGGVFLRRFQFHPHYTTEARLECPPWADSDLPDLCAPQGSQKDSCASLTLSLIYWIQGYEKTIAEQLGTDYRQSSLDEWKVAQGPITRANEIVEAWRSVGEALAKNPHVLS